jgi:hypothetical protein
MSVRMTSNMGQMIHPSTMRWESSTNLTMKELTMDPTQSPMMNMLSNMTKACMYLLELTQLPRILMRVGGVTKNPQRRLIMPTARKGNVPMNTYQDPPIRTVR